MARDPSSIRLEKSPLYLLHRVGQRAADAFQAELGSIDLTARQFIVLVAVRRNEGISQTELSALTGIDRSTLSDMIRRMLHKGLVQRRRTRDDARAYAVKLTEEGARMLKAAEPISLRVDERVLKTLPAKQRERFVQDLCSIVANLANVEHAQRKTSKR